MHIVGQEENNNTTKRRRWTAAEKAQILDEAERTSFSEAARNHGVTTSLLFQWRKQFQGQKPVELQSPEVHYADRLRTIDDLERQVEPRVIERLLVDINSGKLNGYSAANAYASISNAVARLCAARLELLDRIATTTADKPTEQSTEHSFENPEDGVRKAAERIVYQIAKEQVERERQSRG